MELLVLGGDARFAYLAAQARAQGLDAVAVDLDAVARADVRRAEGVVMPNPFADGNRIIYEETLRALSPGTALYLLGAGGAPAELRERFRVFDLLEDAAFALENAVLTAEGAISLAMERLPCALYRLECLVIGNGRIGDALTRALKGLGARLTVAARRENARAKARLYGAEAVDMAGLWEALPAQRLVFSTPPARVLGENELRRMRPDVCLIDLASKPYGFDLEAALGLGLRASREPGIPGKYCPESAGRALLTAVLAARRGEEREEALWKTR